MLIEDETKVHVGYLRATDQEIRIDYNEETYVEVYNPEKSGRVKIQKTTESMDVKSISGITMILKGTADNGREVEITAVTGADGAAAMMFSFSALFIYLTVHFELIKIRMTKSEIANILGISPGDYVQNYHSA